MVNSSQHTPPKRGHGLGLLCILIGIVLAVVFGMAYGRTMWLASGGPQRKLDRLGKTVEQKESFAAEADQRAEKADQQARKFQEQGRPDSARELREEADARRKEADRLRSQVPVIRAEIHRAEADLREARAADLTVARNVAEIVRFCGDIFLRMLFVIVIPLVVTSMICGVTSLGDVRQLGKVGAWTLVYYFATGAAAVTLGIILVQVIEPGKGTDDTFAYVSEDVLTKQQPTVIGTLLEVVRGRDADPGSGMIPSNIFLAASKTNVLALILFSLVFGGALTVLGEQGKPAIDFFQAAGAAVMKIVRLVIWFTPVGVFGLIATQIADSGGGDAFYAELRRLGWFVATVTIGLAIHLVVLCLVLAIFGRRNPLAYIYALARALLTALSTDSSSATLPVTIECVEESGVSERAAGFVLPLGATINMDGTALYEAVAAIFIAQAAGIPLGGPELVIIFLTATLAAVGAPGIPSAGLVTMLIVLTAVGLPAAGIGTLLAIDWLLDRERTSINVFGDAVGAAVIDRYLGRQKTGTGPVFPK
ncbi:MAG: sodium:dicarboxylate symporter [Planctomycetes bacterium RBG_13_63_9]|nr:MAG: sodium:dicarboxylate symporter [Planctomycetes bacterium RBG_13_63_9]